MLFTNSRMFQKERRRKGLSAVNRYRGGGALVWELLRRDNVYIAKEHDRQRTTSPDKRKGPSKMQTRKVNQDGRGKWLSPWVVIVFTIGAAVGAILSPHYGAGYTSVGLIITGWLVALMLITSDRRVQVSRIGSRLSRSGPAKAGADGGVSSKAAQFRRGSARGSHSSVDSRRALLHPIMGGKSQPR